jgi:hypothetical protein
MVPGRFGMRGFKKAFGHGSSGLLQGSAVLMLALLPALAHAGRMEPMHTVELADRLGLGTAWDANHPISASIALVPGSAAAGRSVPEDIEPAAAAAQPIVPAPRAEAAAAFSEPRERFGLFAGGSDLDTPASGINQYGIRLSAGIRQRSWRLTGFDFSRFGGQGQIRAAALVPPLRQLVLGAIAQYQAAGLLPAGYQYRVNTSVHTITYSLGPQFNTRPFHGAVLFGSPALGALREAATLTGTDAFTTATIAQALPSGHKTDWVPFYGGSGGVDVPLNRHVVLRSQRDVVRSHPFSSLLASALWSYRYSCGILLTFGGPGHGALTAR